MGKRTLATLAAIVFLGSLFPAAALAGSFSNSRTDEIAFQTLLVQQDQLESLELGEDLAGVQALTLNLLDRLIAVAGSGSYDSLPALLSDYSQDLEQIQAQQVDPACGPALILGSVFATIAILQDVQSDGCILINVSNSIADIISDILSYNICVEENSAEPDPEVIAELQSQQSTVEAYDFLTQALDLALCNDGDITGGDVISLLFAFLGIFPDQPEG